MSRQLSDPLIELRYALAEGSALSPTRPLAEEIAKVAFASRPEGRPLNGPEPISSDVAFARTLNALDSLLDSIEDDKWHRPALRDLDIQGVVGHLIGVEHDFQQAIATHNAVTSTNHIEATQGHALAQRDRRPSETYEDWRVVTRRSIDLLSRHSLSDAIALHGLEAPLDSLLLVRTFELWTHEEDIRRALNLPLCAPETPSLQRMVDLAVRFLPMVLAEPTDDDVVGTVRLVLVGAAGGAFNIPVTGHRSFVPTRIVADTVQFCRLVANRTSPADAAISITGDRAFASRLLARATALALD